MALTKKIVLHPEYKGKLYKKVNGKFVYTPDYEIVKDKDGKIVDIRNKKNEQ